MNFQDKKKYYKTLEANDWENLVWHFYEKEYQKRRLTPKPRHIKRLRNTAFSIWCKATGRKGEFMSLLEWTLSRVLKEELRDYLLGKMEKDKGSWGGCSLLVPLKYTTVTGTIEFKENS